MFPLLDGEAAVDRAPGETPKRTKDKAEGMTLFSYFAVRLLVFLMGLFFWCVFFFVFFFGFGGFVCCGWGGGCVGLDCGGYSFQGYPQNLFSPFPLAFHSYDELPATVPGSSDTIPPE